MKQTQIFLLDTIQSLSLQFVQLFMPTPDNSSMLLTVLCDPVEFADLFSVPAQTSVSDLSYAICSMVNNSEALLNELKDTFKIDHYINKVLH